MKKVFFGLPRYSYREDENTETVKDLINTRKNFIVTQTYEIIGRSSISRCRNDIVTEFLKTDAEYLFFLDSDQCWIKQHENEKNPIDRMIACNKDIISPPMITRIQPFRTLWAPYKPEDFNVWGKSEPIQVRHTGTGFTLITRKCIEDVLKEFPAPFLPIFCDKEKLETSDDVAFIRRAYDLGFKAWIIPGIRVGHIGKYPFSPDDIKDTLIEESKKAIKL